MHNIDAKINYLIHIMVVQFIIIATVFTVSIHSEIMLISIPICLVLIIFTFRHDVMCYLICSFVQPTEIPNRLLKFTNYHNSYTIMEMQSHLLHLVPEGANLIWMIRGNKYLLECREKNYAKEEEDCSDSLDIAWYIASDECRVKLEKSLRKLKIS